MEPKEVWIVRRDEKELGRFETENAAFEFLHNYQSQSVDWACRWNGYSIKAGRLCCICGDVLAVGDDVVCGYHSLEG